MNMKLIADEEEIAALEEREENPEKADELDALAEMEYQRQQDEELEVEQD